MDFSIEAKLLQDAKNGKENPWRPKKMKSRQSAHIMRMAGFEKRADRMDSCADYLRFAECECGHKKLVDAKFCQDRLCPMCNWRRSRKHFGQILKVLHAAEARQKLRYIFLTLTVRNVPGDRLSQCLDALGEGFNRLFKYKEVDKPVVGYVRSLEITYNRYHEEYHPHIHVLLGVMPTYFSNYYISQAKWVNFWEQAMGLEYSPIVDVRVVKPKKVKAEAAKIDASAADSAVESAYAADADTPQTAKDKKKMSVVSAVAEAAKYSVKDTDYIFPDDEALSVKVTKDLASALVHRRFLGYGKLFKQLHKELDLSDVEAKDADLVSGNDHTCTCPICSSNLLEYLYKWRGGFYVSTGIPE
jgi:plasmid rolling circle replication initiator protein Rep